VFKKVSHFITCMMQDGINILWIEVPCSLGLSATSQQYFSLRTNQPPATSQNQPAVLFTQNKPAPAISHQTTEQAVSVLR
jgi:hypothetical protein